MAECYVPPSGLREMRALVRHRAGIVKARTTVKNRVHAIVDGYGFRYGYTDMFGKRGHQVAPGIGTPSARAWGIVASRRW